MGRTKNALKILEKVTGDNSMLRGDIASARINLQIAQMIHDIRTQAGLSQRQLADLIGSKQPVIARLEDADYEGHSLRMLQRIAEGLQRRVEVRLVPSRQRSFSKPAGSVERPGLRVRASRRARTVGGA